MTSLNTNGILAIDVGTTNIKCILFNNNLHVIKSASFNLEIIQPLEDNFEIEPENLYDTIKKGINEIINCDKIFSNQAILKIKCLGISTQRNSFLIWNRNTGKLYTNFILWSDKRASNLTKKWNQSPLLNSATSLAGLGSKLFGNHHLNLISKYKVDSTHVSSKLMYQLEILESKLEEKEFGQISYGTIETWLVWRLSKEKLFVTDLSCVSACGFYDIYERNWSSVLTFLFRIPSKILPEIKNTCDDFGSIDKSFFNLDYDIPLRAIVADAQASAIAECCFSPGECVITIGTGSFISVVVGKKPISSNHGNFPLVEYKYKDETIYILHCFVSTAGQSLDWAKSIGLFDNHDEIDAIMEKTCDTGGVFYIPSLLEVPGFEKNNVSSGFIGVKSNTTKNQMLRAVVESLAILIRIKMDGICDDLVKNNISLKAIRVCGGVTKSKNFNQLLANILNFPIEKSNFSNASSVYGAAFLAGLSTGIFDNINNLKNLRQCEEQFYPQQHEVFRKSGYECDLKNWKKALKRYNNWYE